MRARGSDVFASATTKSRIPSLLKSAAATSWGALPAPVAMLVLEKFSELSLRAVELLVAAVRFSDDASLPAASCTAEFVVTELLGGGAV